MKAYACVDIKFLDEKRRINPMNYICIIFLILNIFSMCLYGIDKLLAKKQARRISEKSLVLSAFLMGGIGAMFGMVLFNHKTSKIKFRLLVPLATVLWIVALFFVIYH